MSAGFGAVRASRTNRLLQRLAQHKWLLQRYWPTLVFVWCALLLAFRQRVGFDCAQSDVLAPGRNGTAVKERAVAARSLGSMFLAYSPYRTYPQKHDLDCDSLTAHGAALEGNIGLEFLGRMCNNMLQYLHVMLNAQQQGKGVVKIVSPETDWKYGKNLDAFCRVTWKQARGDMVKAGTLCGGDFPQQYLVLMRHRDLAKCLFSPSYLSVRPKNGLFLRPTDIVIHYRNILEDGEGVGTTKSSLPFAYYRALLSRLSFTKVYIIAKPSLYVHETVVQLQQKFSAEIYKDSPEGDWFFAVMAPTLIGSFGSYSWMAAYLSEGHSVHLPYISNLRDGSDWSPLHNLFIHDDPRLVYHDVLDPSNPTDEAAATVMSRDTVFARAVRERQDPCPGL